MILYNLPQDLLFKIKIPVNKYIGDIKFKIFFYKIKILIFLNNLIDYEKKLKLLNDLDDNFDNFYQLNNNVFFYFLNLIKKKNLNKIEINIPNNKYIIKKILDMIVNILKKNDIIISIDLIYNNLKDDKLILIEYYPYNFKKLSKLFK